MVGERAGEAHGVLFCFIKTSQNGLGSLTSAQCPPTPTLSPHTQGSRGGKETRHMVKPADQKAQGAGAGAGGRGPPRDSSEGGRRLDNKPGTPNVGPEASVSLSHPFYKIPPVG